MGLTTICENFKLEEIFLAVTNEDTNVLVAKTVLGNTKNSTSISVDLLNAREAFAEQIVTVANIYAYFNAKVFVYMKLKIEHRTD